MTNKECEMHERINWRPIQKAIDAIDLSLNVTETIGKVLSKNGRLPSVIEQFEIHGVVIRANTLKVGDKLSFKAEGVAR